METIVPQKYCPRCCKKLPLGSFHKNKSRRDGRSYACKKCKNDYNVPYQRKRPGGTTYAMRTVGFSVEDYKRENEKQNGLCAICGKPETSKNQWGIINLAVDHDHITGKFRGLLCVRCNLKLHALEDQSFVDAAMAYLQK